MALRVTVWATVPPRTIYQWVLPVFPGCACSSSNYVPDNVTTSSIPLTTQATISPKTENQADEPRLWWIPVVVILLIVLLAVVIYCYKVLKQRRNNKDPETPREPNETQVAQVTESTPGHVAEPASAPIERGSRPYMQVADRDDALENRDELQNGRDASHDFELETETETQGMRNRRGEDDNVPVSAPYDERGRTPDMTMAVKDGGSENDHLLETAGQACSRSELDSDTDAPLVRNRVDYTESGSPPPWESGRSKACFIDMKTHTVKCKLQGTI